jgi:hypothetical protein
MSDGVVIETVGGELMVTTTLPGLLVWHNVVVLVAYK